MAPTRSSGKGAKRGRGRPSTGGRSTAAAKPGRKAAATTEKTKRRRSSQKTAGPVRSSAASSSTRPSKRRKSKADAEADEISEVQPQKHKYVQLETRTRRIPQEQIDTWPEVSAQVLEQIVAVIRDAKKDIANTQRDERKVMAAHNTLNPLIRALARQLAASKIPPSAKDVHFNIDKLTEQNAQVFREVTTARHSQQLLDEQLKVAEHLLKKDEENLEELKRNVKEWKVEWKHQGRQGRIHPLLQDSEELEMDGDGPDDIGLRRSAAIDTAMLDAPDSELAPIVEQLRRSLENMQGNHVQVEGMDAAMRDAQAALDDMVFRHASAQQYDAV